MSSLSRRGLQRLFSVDWLSDFSGSSWNKGRVSWFVIRCVMRREATEKERVCVCVGGGGVNKGRDKRAETETDREAELEGQTSKQS